MEKNRTKIKVNLVNLIYNDVFLSYRSKYEKS